MKATTGDLDLPGALESLGEAIAGRIKALEPLLGLDLTLDTFLGHVGGILGTVARLPGTLPIPPGEPSSGIPTASSVIPSKPPILPTLEDKLLPPDSTLGERKKEARVHLPALEKAIQTLDASPIKVGENYLETAEHVKQGAFAITGELTEKAVADVRDVLSKTLLEGKSGNEFIDEVADRLDKEGSPLSLPHIENVFRTNTMSAYSNAQQKAIDHPLVGSAFPYSGYGATHDARVRKEHKALEILGLDGTNIYRNDDPTFKAFRPPWGYNCRCHWYPVTVEQAAKKGVKEAVEWLARAKALAKVQGGSFNQYLSRTAPNTPAYVEPPSFQPDPEFQRDYNG